MKPLWFSHFLEVVPRAVQRAAWSVLAALPVVGLTVGCFSSTVPAERLRAMALDGTAALCAGVLLAAWLLCIGYVHADARRRGMRATLWTWVAALIPNLLGFLLYFAIRQPLTLDCAHCHRAVTPEQAFCSWCGAGRTGVSAAR